MRPVRTEMRAKKVKDILSRQCPQHAFYPRRRDVVVAARYQQIVKLEVREDGRTLLMPHQCVAAGLAAPLGGPLDHRVHCSTTGPHCSGARSPKRGA